MAKTWREVAVAEMLGTVEDAMREVLNCWADLPPSMQHLLAKALASGKLKGLPLAWELLVWSSLQSLTTAAVGVVVLWLFGRWIAIRLSDA